MPTIWFCPEVSLSCFWKEGVEAYVDAEEVFHASKNGDDGVLDNRDNIWWRIRDVRNDRLIGCGPKVCLVASTTQGKDISQRRYPLEKKPRTSRWPAEALQGQAGSSSTAG